jgi:hypothetical protein
MKRRLFMGVVALAVVLTPILPMRAAEAAVCVETNRVTFVPPLTLSSSSGSAGFAYLKQCFVGGSLVYSAAATGLSFSYSGNCVLATIGDGTTLVGGTLMVAVNKQMIFVPDSLNPCSFSTGVGYGTKID